MSEHAPVAVKPADDPAFKLPESLSKLWLPLVVGGLITLTIGFGLASNQGNTFAMASYLTAFMYCLTISLGCLFFVLIQHLCRAGWSVVVRRVAELIMLMVFPLAILFLPIIITVVGGDGILYAWDDAGYAAEHHLDPEMWDRKDNFLNAGWFVIRAVIYFAIWMALAAYYFRGSVRQDETGEKAVTDKMQFWSGPAVMLFSGSLTFAAFDWVMSLAPMWFSTMFGVYIFAGSVLSAHCAILAASYVLQKQGAMRDEVTVEHYHDLGKLIFGFITFWTYISFSQYMLIWYANIPEETEWIWHRHLGAFGAVSLMLIFMHWMLPFFGTMSMYVRRRPTLLCGWAVYILVMHFIDIYWMIMPEAGVGSGHVVGILATVICVGGMATIMAGLVLRLAQDTKLVPVRDPRLRESIVFENI